MGCITEVTGSVEFSGIDSLTNLNGMATMRTIGGNLKIWGNDTLTDISGLSGLESVGGDVEIRLNDALCKSDVDAFIAGISIGGSVDVEGNADC